MFLISCQGFCNAFILFLLSLSNCHFFLCKHKINSSQFSSNMYIEMSTTCICSCLLILKPTQADLKLENIKLNLHNVVSVTIIFKVICLHYFVQLCVSPKKCKQNQFESDCDRNNIVNLNQNKERL